ncbi:peptidase M64 N-terminal domain-containing protein, partial [uncultured Prevotella sp.]
MKKILFALALATIGATESMGQSKPQEVNFTESFCDSTLRIDYIFSGNATTQRISLDKLNMSPRWYGKRKHLFQLPVEGNGQITVRKHGTSEVIYRNSFSTLFQEWQSYDEAKNMDKAFENVFLIPMPKEKVDVTVDLRNNRHEVTGTMTHTVDPSDILIRHTGFKNRTPYTTIQQAADTTRCIHIAYVAEGYKKDEMNVFVDDAKIATEALFEHEPFKSMRNRFNIVAVESPSVDSGTSEPSKGIWRNTALGSHFDTFYSDRYLTTLNLKSLHDVLAGTPYEHIIVLVNTKEYGGGGILNSYNLSMTHHPMYKQVVVHEFGHS